MYEASSTETLPQHTRKNNILLTIYITRDLYLYSSLLYYCMMAVITGRNMS